MSTHLAGHISQPPSLVRRVKGYISGALPGIMLILMPKCPACLAAYLSVGTGISFTTAKYLRISLIILCLAMLLVASPYQDRLHPFDIIHIRDPYWG